MDNYELKYTVSYVNIANDTFLLEIYQKSDFTFDENQLAGSVVYTKGSVEDVFKPIRPTSLTIDLEASQTNVLQDFQTFNEFDFKVKFYRNSLQIFEGWITPSGYFQNWVDDKWIISMSATDGMGTLGNLEFSDEETIEIPGSTIEYRYAAREFNYLHIILKRLGYELPYTIGDDINVDLGVPVDWVDIKKRLIDRNVFINDNGTFQDCETILKDILQKYNLTITQANIEGRLVWYISRVIYAAYPNEAKRNRQYTTSIDASGGSDSVEVILTQFDFADGHPLIHRVFTESNTNQPGTDVAFDAIHCNENQQITFKPTLQNFRFQSNWKGLRSFLGDIEDFWSEIPPMPEYPTAAEQWGIVDGYMRMWQVFTGDLVNDPWFVSDFIRPPTPIEIGVKILIDWWVDYNFVNPAVEVPAPVKFRFVMEYVTDTYTRYFDLENNIWTETPEYIEFEGTWPTPGAQPIGVVTGQAEILAPPGGTDASGQYRLSFYSPYGDNTGYHECRITDVDFAFQTEQFGSGKTHDSTQPEKRSSFLVEPVTIINTNETNAYFQNNLYRLASPPETITGLVPMTDWKAWGTDTYDDLLELTGRERIKAKVNPQKIFTGDIFGYIPYWSVIRYDGIDGNFVPLSYSYITTDNIIQLETVQVFNENVVINHEKKYIFENERNVLIKEL